MNATQRKSKADKIKYSMVFTPPVWEENGDQAEYDFALKEYREAQDWLMQFYNCRLECSLTGRKVLLIVGTETYVEQVWSMKNDNYRGTCYLEWELPKETGNED